MLRVPLLLVHGERDVNVPVEHSRRLLRALERQHADVESVFYPKSGHGFTDPDESADYLRRVEAFLARHNPAEAPATAAPAAAASSAVPAH
jgi:dipeptidyl aminopeptidase/acylaminoacyl peptidase